MESLYSRRSNHIIGFHGCDESVVRKVVNGEEDLIPSTNDYDWLGNGIYFWENNEARALQWATELSKRHVASISIGDKEFSYFCSKDEVEEGDSHILFIPSTLLDLMRRIV